MLAEVDRAAGTSRLYVDGTDVSGDRDGQMPAAGVSLDNDADFVVGEGLIGAIDYLRISRGTLVDAQTTIKELMAWQFNGPNVRDFVGREPTGGVRDVGAVEHPTESGRRVIDYTPPAEIAQQTPAPMAGSGDELKTGDDRTVKTLAWGVVSVPKRVAVGQRLDVQVVFGTETIEKPHKLQIDLHAIIDGKRKPGYGRAHPINVTPGSTKPYSADLTARAKEGLERIIAVIYASPDGSYSNNTVATEVSVPVVAVEMAKAHALSDSLIMGEKIVKEYDWGTITVPKQTAVGQSMPVEVRFKEGKVTQNGVLRIDLHWWQGKKRAGVMAGARHPNLRAGDTGPVVKQFTIKDKEGLSALAVVAYASPDGAYGQRFIDGEAGGIVVVAAQQLKQDPPAEEPAPQSAETAGQVETKKLDWGTITITKEPKVGEVAEVTVMLAEGVVREKTVLTVDMHWWQGKSRAGVAGRFGRKTLEPGETGPFRFTKQVPDKDGIAAIAGVVSLSPDGSWTNKTHTNEIGTRIRGD